MIAPDLGARIEQLRDRHEITDVLLGFGVHVPDRRPAGGYMISCPVPGHYDRTPSCIVHEDTGRYHCFGCGAHGDVVQLVRDVLGLSLIAAIDHLDGGGRRSVKLPTTQYRQVSPRTGPDRIIQINDVAWSFLTEAGPTAQARSYLRRRGIPIDELERDAGSPLVGYTPARPRGLVDALRGVSFTDAEILDAGWAIERDGNLVDRFRRRVLFPIHDDEGHLLAVTGRDVTGLSPHKYLNSPTTSAYRKGDCLYSPAIRSLASARTVALCEGPIDALAIAASGPLFGEGVRPISPCGTALTDAQAHRILAMRPERVLLCPDGDRAGRSAGREWFRRFSGTNPVTEIVSLTGGHDPASWLAGRVRGRTSPTF